MDESDPDRKEIYHRLKNHMAVINSLIRLKASSTEDLPAMNALEETGGLVSAVTLVYQLLYRNAGEAGIPVSWYIRELIDHLEQTLTRRLPEFSFNLPSEKYQISPEKAVPLGIMVAELIIDSAEGPVLTVSLEPSDDGAGGWVFSFSRYISSEDLSGLMLAGSLVSQLDGRILPGDSFSVAFSEGLLSSG
ncbi:MAG: hypothetical protein JEY99_05890 [Spirochaetales bacterium]|nr:hypothetical protein [Spirochaetales bacterium]